MWNERKEEKSLVELSQSLRALMSSQGDSSFIAYTDGSTDPRGVSSNSGVGIYVTDVVHRPVWEGGMVVRSDKNNFTPEIAAAAIVIDALPENVSLCLRMDSLAALNALRSGALVSERRRVRAAGRSWLNWIRRPLSGMLGARLEFEHVRSHSDEKGPAEIGNDEADRVANAFRRSGDGAPPVPYMLSTDERYLIECDGKMVTGDVRSWAKDRESQYLLEMWKARCPRQSEWMSRTATQILRMAKEVWTWSIGRSDGKAWLYFIFSCCQWLPTNYRAQYKSSSNPEQRCSLCLTGELEDMNHLLRCPALVGEHERMCLRVSDALASKGVPFPPGAQSRGERDRASWLVKARGIFPSPPSRDSKTLSSVKLASLLDDWLRTNGADSFRGFQQAVNNRLLAYDCGCREASHKCYLKNCWSLSSSLLEVLAAELSLEVEGMADALHHSPILGEWWSKDTIDLQFGAKLDFFAQDCTGRNVYVNPPFNDFGRDRQGSRYCNRSPDSVSVRGQRWRKRVLPGSC